MRIISLFSESKFHLMFEPVDGRLVHRHEDLIGRCFEGERVSLGVQCLTNAVGRLIGIAGDLEVQVVSE